MFDVMIVGGSFAGMSAALQVARARQRVLVVDAGIRRNRFTHASHGFLGSDGRDPADLAAKGRTEVLAYPNVTWVDGTVVTARKDGDTFTLHLASGEQHTGKRVILALGVADDLPDIPGLRERWGKSVFHCPYCDGYELHQGNIACLATSPMSIHHALMLPDWGTITYFLNGAAEPDEPELAALAKRGVRIVREAISSVSGAIDVHLANGTTESFAGLFAAPRTRPSSPLAEQLGCELADGPMGPFVKTDDMKETTVPGVFSCGDVALAAGSLAFAVGDGARAGVSAHRSLIFR